MTRDPTGRDVLGVEEVVADSAGRRRIAVIGIDRYRGPAQRSRVWRSTMLASSERTIAWWCSLPATVTASRADPARPLAIPRDLACPTAVLILHPTPDAPWLAQALATAKSLIAYLPGHCVAVTPLQDPEGYRDRSQDTRLQRAGYFVMRVVAEDVDQRLASTLDQIARALAGRHASRGHV